MDTNQFLDAVLPAQGERCVAVLGTSGFAQRFRDPHFDFNKSYAVISDRANTYFGCAAYTGSARRAGNVVAVRSFWMDIDTQEGKPREKYADRREAIAELAKFCKDLHLPTPMVVDSGFGIHVYWPCEHDMTPVDWLQTAQRLKAATGKWGLAVDPTRTADIASILRPVGTFNHKGGEIRPVRLLTKGTVTTREKLDSALAAFVGEEVDSFMPVGTGPVIKGLNSDLYTAYESVPSDANKIADKCAVIGHMRATRGADQREPLWHLALGVLRHTVQGAAVCQEWSSGHVGYSSKDVATRLDRWGKTTGPSTCAKFSDNDSACATCPHKGKITTPLELGREYGPPPVEVTITLPDSTTVEVKERFPVGFGYGAVLGQANECLYYIDWSEYEGLKDDGDTPDDKQQKLFACRRFLADYLLIPVTRIGTLDGNYSMTLRLVSDKIGIREFVVDNGVISEGGKSLFSELGRREVNVAPHLRPHMHRYLNEWIGTLRENYDEVPAVEQFGWQKDGFVVGEDYLTTSGRKTAMLHGTATSIAHHMGAAGTLDAWVSAVDRAYNHPGDEPLQYCVLTAFAAPLWKMFGENGGVTVFAHSTGSGYGKSTAQQVGLSAWGYYPELMLREGNFTVGGLYQHIGVMNNLPVVIDEMTNASRDFASALVYNMSAGKGKTRLNSDATMKKTYNWATITAASGNQLITEKLALHRADTEAEMARVWEFTVTKRSTITPNEALTIFGTFTKNYGHAGRVFAEYLVANHERVGKQLHQVREQFNDEVGIRQQERYWSCLNACVLTALSICHDLKLLSFDATAMRKWIKSVLEKNRGQIVSSSSNPLELFGDMLSDIFPGVLVTDGEGVANGNPAPVVREPHGSITGRSILSFNGQSRNALFLSTTAIKTWCDKRGLSYRELFDALVAAGWVSPEVKRIVLGKGTVKYAGLTGQVRCWDVLPHAIQSAGQSDPIAQRAYVVVSNETS